MVWGPTPIPEAIDRIDVLSRSGLRLAYGGRLAMARLLALQGRFAEALGYLAEAEPVLRDHGDRHLLSQLNAVRGDIALLQGDLETAIREHRASYDSMTAQGDLAFSSTYAAECAEAYLAAGDIDQANAFATIAIETSASDDIASQGGGRAVQACVLSSRGDHAAAEALAREAADIFGRTDYVFMHADALVYQARVLRAAGKQEEALAAARKALDLYAQKQATFLVERTSRLIAEWSP
jgi:ATP/maltotriose-dependent transcriptional regulator MalT